MTNDERWQKCEDGIIRNVVATQLQHKQAETLNRRAMVTGTVATAVGGGLLLLRALTAQESLSCAQVKHLANDYTRNLLPQLQTQLVDDHRHACRHCDRYLLQLSAASAS